MQELESSALDIKVQLILKMDFTLAHLGSVDLDLRCSSGCGLDLPTAQGDGGTCQRFDNPNKVRDNLGHHVGRIRPRSPLRVFGLMLVECKE